MVTLPKGRSRITLGDLTSKRLQKQKANSEKVEPFEDSWKSRWVKKKIVTMKVRWSKVK